MSQSSQNRLVDAFQRQIDYLRLSVTDRCNLRCCYCAPNMPKPKPDGQLLTLEEMYALVTIGMALGISKVRLTGGEPLCRNGLEDFIHRINDLPKINDISITTNATLLTKKIAALKKAGLRRINISLDTLDRLKYKALTGADRFNQVWDGIMTAVAMGFGPVKINTVVMKGFNDDEIEKLAALSLTTSLHVRFIEYMPIGTDPFPAKRFHVPIAGIMDRLQHLGELIPVKGQKTDGPAQRYRYRDAAGEIGLIGSMSHHFCHSCNRLRLTSDGKLRPCLLTEDQIDIRAALRAGASRDQLKAIFVKSISRKKHEHEMRFTRDQRLATQMVNIGG